MNKKDLVKHVLETLPRAREDDLWMYAMCGAAKGLTQDEARTLYSLMQRVGNFEGYRRARQLIQADHPELRPNDAKQHEREDFEEEMRVTRGGAWC